MSDIGPLNYHPCQQPSSRAALVLFIASIVAFFTFFLILPPLLTLAFSLTIRHGLKVKADEVGLRHAGAAFATSVIGSLFAVIVAAGLLFSTLRFT